MPCVEPACAIDLVISPGSVQVDAVLTVFEAEAASAANAGASPGGGGASQGGTAYAQLTAEVVAAAQALGSAPPDDAGVAALSSGLDGVDVQPLPSVTVEEPARTLTLTLTLTPTRTRTLTLTLTLIPTLPLTRTSTRTRLRSSLLTSLFSLRCLPLRRLLLIRPPRLPHHPLLPPLFRHRPCLALLPCRNRCPRRHRARRCRGGCLRHRRLRRSSRHHRPPSLASHRRAVCMRATRVVAI